MVNVEMVDRPADGGGPSGQFHSTELENYIRAINGYGVLGSTFNLEVTESDLNIVVPLLPIIVPDGSGGTKWRSGSGTATVAAADPTNPRVDILVMDDVGAELIITGTPTAETGNVLEAPMPAMLADQILLAKIKVGAGVTAITAANLQGRAIDVAQQQVNWVQGDDIASGTALVLPDTTENVFDVTGNNTITTLSTRNIGFLVLLQMDSTPQFTHGANLVLRDSLNFVAAAGDWLLLESFAAGQWREVLRSTSANTIPITWDAEIVKPSDESLMSDTTLQNDDDFSFEVVANEEGIAEIYLLMSSGATPDFKCNWTVPSGAYNFAGGQGSGPPSFNSNAENDLTLIGETAEQLYKIWMHYEIGGSGGTVNFQWAQNTSDGGTTIVGQNSVLYHRRID